VEDVCSYHFSAASVTAQLPFLFSTDDINLRANWCGAADKQWLMHTTRTLLVCMNSQMSVLCGIYLPLYICQAISLKELPV